MPKRFRTLRKTGPRFDESCLMKAIVVIVNVAQKNPKKETLV